MNTRQKLLTTIEQLSDEQLSSLLEFAQTLKQSQDSVIEQNLDIRAFVKLPLEKQQELLAQQAATIAPYFQPGTEDMEWVEDYVEDNNWDDE